MNHNIILAFCWCMTSAVMAFSEPARLRCVGVLGNSGEQGATLVRFSENRSRDQRDGLGIVCDRFGTLWDRAGIGRLNRYALDGRLVASVELPSKQATHLDAACLVDDTLLLLLKEDLWLLDVAAEKLEFKKSAARLRAMAKTSFGGRVLVLLSGDKPQVAWYRPSDDTTEILPWPPVSEEIPGVAVDPEGVPLVIDRKTKTVHALVGSAWQERGRFAEGVPQTVDGYYWTGQWHGTVKRFNAAFAPDPGVVLGGASGSFIGHLEGNYELSSPTAIANVGPSMYALGGAGGVAHLAAWNGATRKLELVRRIGALHDIRGHLALDSTGCVRMPAGFWSWSDGPASPVSLSTGLAGNGQVAVFENGTYFSSAFVYGTTPAAAWGSFNAEAKSTNSRYMPEAEFPGNVRGCVALRGGKGFRTLRVTADVRLIETRHDGAGKPVADVATGTLHGAARITNATSLACLSDGRVLVAADGFIIEIDRVESSGDWKERRRWKSIGGLALGGEAFVTAEGNQVWISDRDNHRVFCVDETLSTVRAAFGGESGDDLAHCDRPGALAASGGRAIVYDSGNQRLLKLELE